MTITLTNYDFKDYRVNKEQLRENDRKLIERVNRDSYIQELNKIFEEYSNCLEAYNLGYITKYQKESCINDLYDKSDYSDIYDFYYDFNRWKVGLPLYIKFKLV